MLTQDTCWWGWGGRAAAVEDFAVTEEVGLLYAAGNAIVGLQGGGGNVNGGGLLPTAKYFRWAASDVKPVSTARKAVAFEGLKLN